MSDSGELIPLHSTTIDFIQYESVAKTLQDMHAFQYEKDTVKSRRWAPIIFKQRLGLAYVA